MIQAAHNSLELQQLQQKYNALPQQLKDAVCNMDAVLSLAAESRKVPLSEIVPMGGIDRQAFACSRQLRQDFVGRVIVFRSLLLPISKDVVNGLITFLDYMEDEDTFLELATAGEVSILCAKYADEARTVQGGYETLASDLLRVGKDMNDKLNKVTLDVQNLLEKQQANMKMASNLKVLSATVVGLGIATGAFMALSLLGPGGLLFAPTMALPAFTASASIGGAVGTGAAYIGSHKTEKGVALKASAKALYEARQAAQQQLPSGVHKFAGAMEHLAKFFSMLSDSVQRIEHTAGRVEARLREDTRTMSYRALYNVLRSQMSKVRESCTSYNEFMSIVNIQVNNLQLDEQQKPISYIESWFQEQQAQAEATGRDASCVPRLLKLRDRSLSWPRVINTALPRVLRVQGFSTDGNRRSHLHRVP